MATFTGQDAYQISLNRFHEIFRPSGKNYISMRKALDMDYALGEALDNLRHQEIEEVYEKGGMVDTRDEVKQMAVSIDATKVRTKRDLINPVSNCTKKKYEIQFRDAKIAAVSEIKWDRKEQEANCKNSSYISGIEYADDFFERIWVEMNRRCSDIENIKIAILGDGAKWIWDRVKDISNNNTEEILDFYHAAEHLSDVCKILYGEENQEYYAFFNKWKKLMKAGKIETILSKLKNVIQNLKGNKRDLLQGQINYFEENKNRMKYNRYIRMKLPIGSGTIESACKNVIGGRLKQGGMTLSENGAKGMLQIRSTLKSGSFLQDFRKVWYEAAA